MVNAVSRVWRFVRGAPLTYLWLTVLLATTVIQHSVNRRHPHQFLVHDSTNIHDLAADPLAVLLESLLWIAGPGRRIWCYSRCSWHRQSIG